MSWDSQKERRETIGIKIEEAEQTLNRINLKKSTARHTRIKFLKTEDKDLYLESRKREMTRYLNGKNNSSDNRFFIRNHGSQKELM